LDGRRAALSGGQLRERRGEPAASISAVRAADRGLVKDPGHRRRPLTGRERLWRIGRRALGWPSAAFSGPRGEGCTGAALSPTSVA